MVLVVFEGLKKQILDVMCRTCLAEKISESNIHATANIALKSIYQQLKFLHDSDEELFCPLYPDYLSASYERVE